MNIIIFGPPGSGKGTQSNLLCSNKALNLEKISVGDILRNNLEKHSSEKQAINSGKLISNKVVFDLVSSYINKHQSKNFLFDGFPRTMEQDTFFNIYNIQINFFIKLNLDKHVILDRLSNGRLIHEKSGRVYHEIHNPPKKKGLDDHTGEKLIKRDDDSRSIILERINIYIKETKKLVDFYKNKKTSTKIIEINANNSIDVVQGNILRLLKI